MSEWKSRAVAVNDSAPQATATSWKDRAQPVVSDKPDYAKIMSLDNKEPVSIPIPLVGGTFGEHTPKTSQQDVEGMINGKFNDTGRNASSPGEKLDSVLGVPVRKGLDSMAQGKGLVQSGKDAFQSTGKDPHTQPTGFDVANHAGIENPYLGTAVATAADLAQLPVGMLAKGAGKVGAMASDGAGGWLKNLAEERAFKALGPVKKFEDANQAKGLVNSIGRTALDEGVVSPLASKKTMLGRAEDLQTKKGNELQGLLNDVDQNKGLTPEQIDTLQASKFIPSSSAAGLKAKISQDYSELPQEVVQPRLDQVDTWLSSKEPKSIQQAQDFKNQMKKFITDSSFYKDNPGAAQETLLGVRNAAKEGIEKNADAYAGILGKDGGAIKNTNRQLGNAMEMSNILEDRISRNGANRSISPSDYASAIIGEHAMGPFGLLAAGANKFAREKGSQLMATGANSASKMLLKSPEIEGLLQKSPTLQALAEKDPTAFEQAIAQLGIQRKTGAAPVMAADNDKKKSMTAGN